MKNPLYCSFCGKRQDEVFFMVAGPTVFICDECVDLCHAIVEEKRAAAGLSKASTEESTVPDFGAVLREARERRRS